MCLSGVGLGRKRVAVRIYTFGSELTRDQVRALRAEYERVRGRVAGRYSYRRLRDAVHGPYGGVVWFQQFGSLVTISRAGVVTSEAL